MRRYRTFWPRFWGGFVDGLVFLPISLADEYFFSPDRGKMTIVVWVLISYTAYWIYSVLMHARYGQTLGKMATGVQVLDLTEARLPTFKQAFMRDLPWILSTVATLLYVFVLVLSGGYTKGAELTGTTGNVITWIRGGWFLLELITMFTNDKRRALHDFLAGTVVVRKRETAVPLQDQSLAHPNESTDV